MKKLKVIVSYNSTDFEVLVNKFFKEHEHDNVVTHYKLSHNNYENNIYVVYIEYEEYDRDAELNGVMGRLSHHNMDYFKNMFDLDGGDID